MSQSMMQLVLAALGVGGTLAAAILTQVLQKRAERERRAAEDLRRWHADRFRVAKDLLYKVMESQRILWSACASLPNESEYASLREADHTTLLAVPETDAPAASHDYRVFDVTSLEIVREALEQAFGLLEEAEHLTAEISILSDGATPTAAKDMFEAAWFAVGSLETTRGTQDEAFEAVLAMRDPTARFQAAVRDELGITVPAGLGRIVVGRRGRSVTSSGREPGDRRRLAGDPLLAAAEDQGTCAQHSAGCPKRWVAPADPVAVLRGYTARQSPRPDYPAGALTAVRSAGFEPATF
ncbi:hypothetical protein ACGFSD_32230 [Streptomyces caniferus]|uniref:hypothetical protein n=1 Tax=Streptomyces caniferus TaxID=285557 RepID=UPI003712BAC6